MRCGRAGTIVTDFRPDRLIFDERRARSLIRVSGLQHSAVIFECLLSDR